MFGEQRDRQIRYPDALVEAVEERDIGQENGDGHYDGRQELSRGVVVQRGDIGHVAVDKSEEDKGQHKEKAFWW